MTVGFRFHPSDHEIISYYLTNKMNGDDFDDIIAEIDLCRHEPWELPQISIIKDDDEREWYFFCRPDYKYRNSKRANRTTRYGFWKPTGKVRTIRGQGAGGEIGTKRTLVFYSKTSGSTSSRTGWVIHEYQVKNFLPHQREFIFCKLKDKADEQADNLITEEGEPSNLVVLESESHPSPVTFNVDDLAQLVRSQTENHSSSATFNGDDVAQLLQLLTENHPPSATFNGDDVAQLLQPMPGPAPTAQGLSNEDLLQINLILDESIQSTSQDRDSEEEVDPDSFIVDPDENIIGAGIHFNDYESQRSMSKVYLANVSDTDSEDIHGEYLEQAGSSKLYAGHGSSTGLKQIRRVQALTETLPPLEGSGQIRNTRSVSKNILQMSASSMASKAEKTREPVKETVPGPPSLKEPVKRDNAQAHGLSMFELQANVHVGQASYGVAPRQRKQSFGWEPESGRRSFINAITARQDLKIRSSESASASNETDFGHSVAQAGSPRPPRDHMVAENSSSRPSPPMVYIVNLLVGVLVFIFIVWQLLFFD